MKYALTGTKLLVDLSDRDARPLVRVLWALIGDDDAYGDLRRALYTKVPEWRLIAADGVSAYVVAYDGPPLWTPPLPAYEMATGEAGLFFVEGKGGAWERVDEAEAQALFPSYAGVARIEDFDRGAFAEAAGV